MPKIMQAQRTQCRCSQVHQRKRVSLLRRCPFVLQPHSPHNHPPRKIAKRLNQQRPDNRGKLNVLLQVNIDHEPTKSGVSPEEIDAVVCYPNTFFLKILVKVVYFLVILNPKC
jgi:hypothetical protein